MNFYLENFFPGFKIPDFTKKNKFNGKFRLASTYVYLNAFDWREYFKITIQTYIAPVRDFFSPIDLPVL